jgi:bone morphogenetic protein receptor type-2
LLSKSSLTITQYRRMSTKTRLRAIIMMFMGIKTSPMYVVKTNDISTNFSSVEIKKNVFKICFPLQVEQATNVSCSASKNFCFSAWKIQSDGSMRVESQGCWEHSERCNQATCMGYEEKRTIIFCCCNADYCNSNLIQPTPKTSPVVVSPNSELKNTGKILFKNSAMWISFASTGIMLIIIAVVFFISCRDKSKPLQETSPLAPSGPGYSSNLYNVDNLKPISIIGEGK